MPPPPTGHFIVPQPRPTSEVRFHHDPAPGARLLAVDASLCPGSQIYIAARIVHGLAGQIPEYVDSHVHDVDSLYLFLGDRADLRGLRAVVRLGDIERTVDSPMTVYIPRGLEHSYRLLEGSGTFLSILLHGEFNEHTFGGPGTPDLAPPPPSPAAGEV